MNNEPTFQVGQIVRLSPELRDECVQAAINGGSASALVMATRTGRVVTVDTDDGYCGVCDSALTECPGPWVGVDWGDGQPAWAYGAHELEPARRVKVEGDLYHGRIPDGAVYVGREAVGIQRSPYANPHTVATSKQPTCQCGAVHDQGDAVRTYAVHLTMRPDLVAAARSELSGQVLACWCRLEQLCHGDVLALVADGQNPLLAADTVLDA